MGLFDFSKKENVISESKPLFSKKEMEDYIRILSDMSYIFRDSKMLTGGRNETMKNRLHSYVGILGYYYEDVYHYGKVESIVNNEIYIRYTLVSNTLQDVINKRNTIFELSDNWSGVLQVIFNMQLEPNEEGDNFKQLEPEISRVTSAFEKISGKKCKEPKDPRNVIPRQVTFNPLGITEDLALSRGHSIPDLTSAFAQDLIPQLTDNYTNKESRDIVAEYAISLIKSYYDNAGFVPMVIVDQITGQINQVVEFVQKISYAPYPSLKEYVLSKIYK